MDKEDLTPMDTPHSVPVRFRLTREQYEKLKKGITPDIDTRWFVLFEDNIIHCYRTWTGYEVFRAELKPDGENFIITELLAESNKKKYNSESEEREIKSFAKIIAWFVLEISENDIQY